MTTTTADKGEQECREAFEREYQHHPILLKRFGNGYSDADVDAHWIIYQGAWASIARHLSSKQTDHLRDATKMVKADAVKMPDPVLVHDAYGAFAKHEDGEICVGYLAQNWRDTKYAILTKARAEGFKGTITARLMELGWQVKPLVSCDKAESYATAHTAEAVRELVEGLSKVAELQFSEAGEPLDDAVDIARALLAKYAPSQEGDNRG